MTVLHSPVNQFIGGRVIEGEVKSEVLILQILGQIHFGLRFMHNHIFFVWDGHNVDVFLGHFYKRK